MHGEFLVHASWAVVPQTSTVKINLSLREQYHIAMVYSWADRNYQEKMSDALLTREIIDRFLTVPSRSHMLGRDFLHALISLPIRIRLSPHLL